jgi:hypothetical protein
MIRMLLHKILVQFHNQVIPLIKKQQVECCED